MRNHYWCYDKSSLIDKGKANRLTQEKFRVYASRCTTRICLLLSRHSPSPLPLITLPFPSYFRKRDIKKENMLQFYTSGLFFV